MKELTPYQGYDNFNRYVKHSKGQLGVSTYISTDNVNTNENTSVKFKFTNGYESCVEEYDHKQCKDFKFTYYQTGLLVSHIKTLEKDFGENLKISKQKQVYEFYNNHGAKIWNASSTINNKGKLATNIAFKICDDGIHCKLTKDNYTKTSHIKYENTKVNKMTPSPAYER